MALHAGDARMRTVLVRGEFRLHDRVTRLPAERDRIHAEADGTHARVVYFFNVARYATSASTSSVASAYDRIAGLRGALALSAFGFDSEDRLVRIYWRTPLAFSVDPQFILTGQDVAGFSNNHLRRPPFPF
jgi:hypothetical protein